MLDHSAEQLARDALRQYLHTCDAWSRFAKSKQAKTAQRISGGSVCIPSSTRVWTSPVRMQIPSALSPPSFFFVLRGKRGQRNIHCNTTKLHRGCQSMRCTVAAAIGVHDITTRQRGSWCIGLASNRRRCALTEWLTQTTRIRTTRAIPVRTEGRPITFAHERTDSQPSFAQTEPRSKFALAVKACRPQRTTRAEDAPTIRWDVMSGRTTRMARLTFGSPLLTLSLSLSHCRNTRHGTSSDGSDRDVAYYESRCAQYGAIHPDFDTHWRRPWGHAEHRCQPPYQGWWCLLRGYLLNNEELKARGYAEREFAERERKNERRRRWALFKAEIRARRGRSNTPYTT